MGMLRIAIDGPAAAGKSTVGQMLARDIGSLYVDTGAMYRALAWLALRDGIDVVDEARISALAGAAAFVFPDLDAGASVNPITVIDGWDATEGLRTKAVDAVVSVVAAYPGVRRALVQRQRELAGTRSVVMVGRDIGTVVLPDADLKVYLTASAAERARRRVEENLARGETSDYAAILAAIQERDRVDSERQASPLRPALDAFILDTTGLAVPQVVAKIVERLRR
jgi:cytidylate kinase